MSTIEKQLNPTKYTCFFMLFSFFLHSFPAFLPHTHFHVQILLYPLQEFTSDSSSMLPQCLQQSLILCLCGKQLLVMDLELSVIIYEKCELPSLFRCFLCDFIWLTTERDFEKEGRNRKDLLKMAVFTHVSQGEWCHGLQHSWPGTPRTLRGIKDYDLFCYHYAGKKKV